MREILFKAKRIDNGEWVEGWLFLTEDNTYIAYVSQFDDDLFLSPKNIFIAVDIETICQYTGLTDKNGNKIWENDLIEVKNGKSHFISQIEWDDWCKGFMFQDTKTTACGMDAFSDSGCYHFDYEVIGNIFDNPELIKECD